ncbi:threonine synthase [mine drainage metagenome]|uniref:Threonine synthase n=1 Tax=mine drainage metagenome TaxID=410659 RepID=T1BW40_9ZZZZ
MNTQVECSKCRKGRTGLEYICRTCDSLFTLKVNGKYSDKITENFPYVKEWLMNPEFGTPILSFNNLSMKLDYYIPTLSYKDRGMVNLFSFIKSNNLLRKESYVNEDSSGNAGASFSFFSMMTEMKARIFVSSTANRIKIDQIRTFGGEIVSIEGSREDVFKEASSSQGTYLGHSFMPEFRDGIRTLAYEIFKQREKLPDRIIVPLSAGTLFLGLLSGFEHLQESGEINEIPEIIAVQPEIISPVYDYIYSKVRSNYSKSVADALITVKSPHIEELAKKIKLNGRCITVSEKEIIDSQKSLMNKGIYTEFSSATTFAAYNKLNDKRNTLLILTGSGLKNI